MMKKGKHKKTEPPPNYLSAWREFRGLTQEQLGAKAGTTKSVISLLESSDRGLSGKWMRRLGPALGIQPGWLIDHHPDDISKDLMEIWGGDSRGYEGPSHPDTGKFCQKDGDGWIMLEVVIIAGFVYCAYQFDRTRREIAELRRDLGLGPVPVHKVNLTD